MHAGLNTIPKVCNVIRDRVHAQGTKDLFSECARADDKAIRKRLEGGVEEALADIPNFRFNIEIKRICRYASLFLCNSLAV